MPVRSVCSPVGRTSFFRTESAHLSSPVGVSTCAFLALDYDYLQRPVFRKMLFPCEGLRYSYSSSILPES